MRNLKDTIYLSIILFSVAFNISGFISLVLKTNRNLLRIEDELNGIRRNFIRSSVNYDDVKQLPIPPCANKDGWYSAGPTPTIEQVVNKYHEIIRATYEKESACDGNN